MSERLPPMKLLKTEQRPARMGGTFFYLFWKNPETGKSYRQCVYPKYYNYSQWREVIEKSYVAKKVLIISNLVTRSGNLIDSDSNPHIDAEEAAMANAR